MDSQQTTSGPRVRQAHFTLTYYEWQERRWRLFKRTLRSWIATTPAMPQWTGIGGTRAELEAELIPAMRFYFGDPRGSMIATRTYRVASDQEIEK